MADLDTDCKPRIAELPMMFERSLNYFSMKLFSQVLFPRPWEIGRPQAAIVEVIKNREIEPGSLLDVGCGTGENAIFLARSGFCVSAIDTAPNSIKLAKKKALKQNVAAEFRIGNVLQLDRDFEAGKFDAVLDCGLFHFLGDAERPVYARQIGRVMRVGGKYLMLCVADERYSRDATKGPRRVSRHDIEETLSSSFRIHYIHSTFQELVKRPKAKAYITLATKV